MNPSVVAKMKWIAWNVVMLSVFMSSVFLMTGLFLGGVVSQAFAQSPNVNESGEKPPYDLMETQADQMSQEGQAPTSIFPDEEDELMAFDPSTVPESVPLSDADWVFSVPVDIKNMPAEVKGIYVYCYVFSIKNRGAKPPFGHEDVHFYGRAEKTVPLTGGAYQGNVIIGVNAEKGGKYTCGISLIGPDGGQYSPTTALDATPRWRIVSSDAPFKRGTGAVNLPD